MFTIDHETDKMYDTLKYYKVYYIIYKQYSL